MYGSKTIVRIELKIYHEKHILLTNVMKSQYWSIKISFEPLL